MIKKFPKKLIMNISAVFVLAGIVGFAYLGSAKNSENMKVAGESEESTAREIKFIKLKGCPDEAYEDVPAEIVSPSYFICRGYLTDGEYVYYHGIRGVVAPNQPLAPSFIATSSPNTKDTALMNATIIEGADPETFEIIYFDEATPPALQNSMLSFARDKNYLYWEGKRFEGVDPDTFAILGRGFIKDKDSVYFWWHKLEGSDPDTFEFLWSGFARDKNFVYRNNPQPEIFQGVDPATFEKIDDAYLKDKDAVYYQQKKIEGSDPDTFEFLYGYMGKDMGKAYAKDKTSVYYLGKEIAGVDPETFEFLQNGWSKDKNAVYGYGVARLDGIDPATFEFVGQGYQYVKDKNGIYYDNGKKFYGADQETFEVLSGGYVKDKNSVWIASYGNEGGSMPSHRKVEGADASSFEVIEQQYARDKGAVYCFGNVMDGFDWGSVVMLQNNYIRDKNLVFFGCGNIAGADAKSFEVLDYQYAKDKNSVYYLGKEIAGADAESFKKLICEYAKDKNNVYKSAYTSSGQTISVLGNFDAGTFRVVGNCNPADKNGVYTMSGKKIEDADPETFEFIGGSYSKDAHRAYWNGVMIEGADVATFMFITVEFAKDKNTTYYKGKVYDDELRAILMGSGDDINMIMNPNFPPPFFSPDSIMEEPIDIVPSPIPIYPAGF